MSTADSLADVDAELERVRGEINMRYGAMRGLVAGGGSAPSDAIDKRAEAICRELDTLFTRRGALLRKRAEFPTGVGPAPSTPPSESSPAAATSS